MGPGTPAFGVHTLAPPDRMLLGNFGGQALVGTRPWVPGGYGWRSGPTHYPSSSIFGMNLSEGHLREIGRVTATFNTLETMLRFITWHAISDVEGVGEVATRGDRLPTLVRKLKAVADIRVRDEEIHQWVLGWADRVLAANQIRAEIVHSIWLPSTDDQESLEKPISVRFSKRGHLKAGALSVEALTTAAALLQSLIEDGMTLMGKLASLFPSMRAS
jgi:hypothetical protein